jgi:ankyrin repeat protein
MFTMATAATHNLMQACLSRFSAGQQTREVQACLAAGGDPDTAFFGASATSSIFGDGGEPEAARLLLRAGAGDARAQVLHQSVRSGAAGQELTKIALEYARDEGLDWVNVLDKNLRTPLLVASAGDAPGVVRLLLEYGADVTAVDSNGMSALHGARHPEIANLLLQSGAHVNARNAMKLAPLHHARTVELADALIDGGADVDAQDIRGNTPAMYAAIMRRPQIAMRLLQRGADVAVRDQCGHTLLDHAIKTGCARLMRAVLSRDVAAAAAAVDVAWAVQVAKPDGHCSYDYDYYDDDDGCTPMACLARMHDPAALVRTDVDVAVYLLALQREVRDLQRVTPDLQEAACQLAARWRELHGPT